MGKEKIKCRTILWYLTFVGMAVNYMVRININMTVVVMVKQRLNTKSAVETAECLTKDQILLAEKKFNSTLDTFNNDLIPKITGTYNESEFPDSILLQPTKMQKKEMTGGSIEKSLLRYFGFKIDEAGFDWNEYEQGLALGSFYWLHWVTQVPGGILSKKYGPKLVYGVANFVSSLLCFLMPMASYLSFDVLIFLRVFQGLITGFAWPAMHTMVASWIPPNERSKFVSAYLGSSFGVFINYPLFGAIISSSCWENVFHFCGIFGTVWYMAWCYFVYDTPAKHPRIAYDERQYIEKSLGTTVQKKNYPTPWKEILTSRIVWMIVIAQWGGIWGLFTLMTQAPTYFKYIHGWDIKMSGFLSGLPHLLRMLFALLFSWLGDYLLRNEKMSRTNVRKFGTAVCTIVKGLFVVGLAYSGCNSLAAIVLLTLAVGVHGSVSTGPLAAVVDIAPNFAGVTLGISGMVGVASGFVSPIVVGLLTLNNQTAKQWEYVFLITAGMLIISGVLYCLFADSKLQSWNSPAEKPDVEMEYLNNTPKNVLKNDDTKKEEALNGIEPKQTLAVPILLIEEVADRISDSDEQ